LKIKPMMDALSILREETQEKFLSLIGVRLGESAARDQRIAIACGNDAECGQGYYQETTPANVADVMAPIVHWRTCHVWDLLQGFGPDHKLPTTEIAEIYGIGTELEEVSSRTGCTACNLASRDVALDRIIRLPKWSYLQPLKELKPLYAELKKPYRRLRKTKGERNSSGDLVSNLHRLGPMTMETRLWGLNQILSIQKRINLEAIKTNMPEISLINPIEHNRILELIDLNTWPDKWSGEEETGDVLHDQVIAEGVVQPLIFENDWK
jgi:DNA sulfur modification protein DndC